MTSLNPSHLLISRNPRSPAHPQLAPASTTSLIAPTPAPHLYTYGYPQGTAGPSSAGLSPSPTQYYDASDTGGPGPSTIHHRSHSTPAISSALDSPGAGPSQSPGGGQGTGYAYGYALATGYDAQGDRAEDRGHASQGPNQQHQTQPQPSLLSQPSQHTNTQHTAGGSNPSSPTPSTTSSTGDHFEIHPTFRRDAALPGRIKVVVGKYVFWCHKEVLWFSSPFFNGLLQGGWAETAQSAAPSIAESPPQTLPRVPSPISGDRFVLEPLQMPDYNSSGQFLPLSAYTTFSAGGIQAESGQAHPKPPSPQRDAHARGDPYRYPRRMSGGGYDEYDSDSDVSHDATQVHGHGTNVHPGWTHPHPNSHAGQSSTSTALLPTNPSLSPPAVTTASAGPRGQENVAVPVPSWPGSGVHRDRDRDRERERAEAVVELRDESPAAFHDFLFWAYPHLECKVMWTNVEALLALSRKLIVPALQKLCEAFLMTHASGRPIMALGLAELHDNAELYREASRFVLDQATWDSPEFETLSEQTQIKLSMRRTWFLERLLKLGTLDVKKEYTCRLDCPDPSRCQTQLDEKWRQAHQAVSRYGPPQPSVAFRCLRQLETFPTNPSLVMSHPLCQIQAKRWVMTLFDRMFQPKLAFGALNPGTDKYWLYITLNS